MLRTITIASILTIATANGTPLQYWPHWRGPLATGEAPLGNPPTEWNEEHNIRWKTRLPGSGHSTPVIWEDHIFITASQPYGEKLGPPPPQPSGAHNNKDAIRKHNFIVLAVSRSTGQFLWKKIVRDARPNGSTHETGTWASPSTVTDGEHVYAFFGSNGLYCLDFKGKVIWEVDLGDMIVKHGHGEGASPALYGERLIINWDHEGDSFIAAFDKRTGKEIWRQPREEVTSWTSPIIIQDNGRAQAVVCGSKAIRGYDLETGKVLWSCGGLSNNVVATPVFADGVLYAGSSYDTRNFLAIRIENARGDISNSKRILWSSRLRPPYVPSPLLYDDTIYYLRHYQNILTRRSVKTGAEDHGPFRLPGVLNLYASPVAAAGRIYLTDQQGSTVVIDHQNPKPLALNTLDEGTNASIAIVGGDLIIRGTQHLYCIREIED